MEKYCKYCKNTKKLSEFNKSSVHKDGYNARCRKCSNEKLAIFRAQRDPIKRKAQIKAEYQRNKHKVKEYFQNRKDGLNHVYILPTENYAGVTQSPLTRKAGHKSNHGRYVEDMRVIFSSPNREEALELEHLLHSIGYQGKHSKNSYK